MALPYDHMVQSIKVSMTVMCCDCLTETEVQLDVNEKPFSGMSSPYPRWKCPNCKKVAGVSAARPGLLNDIESVFPNCDMCIGT